MVRLRESDFRAVLGFLREAEAVEGPDPFPVPVLEELTRVIPCEWVHFCELDRQRRHVASDTYSRGERFEDELVDEERWRVIEQLPLSFDRMRAAGFIPMKISDVYSRRELHRLEIYAERLRPMGTEDELKVRISPSPRHTRNFLFHSRRDFDERDREVLNLLQPHLAYLYGHAADRRALATALVALEVSGRMLEASSSSGGPAKWRPPHRALAACSGRTSTTHVDPHSPTP